MKLKTILGTSTALALLATTGVAIAANNEAFIDQSGDGNSASVTQNVLAITGNQAGSSADHMSQTGANNSLVIIQDGDGGQIGVKSGTDAYFTPDHPYSGGVPQFSITYQGIEQTSSGLASNGALLTQHGTGSVIGEVKQTASGSMLGNTATVTQTGANTVNHLWQIQNVDAVSNVITVTQTGSGNVIDRIDQKASGAGIGNNTITVNMSGSDNGTMDLTALAPFYSSRAWAMGATQSALIQNNYGSTHGVAVPGMVAGNIINLTITGDNNQYGLTQKGSDNSAGLVTISGDSNIFGSYQAGQTNVISAGDIQGNYNDVGIWQIGTTNTATVSILGATSDANGLSIAQQGTSNDATVQITGSGNGNASFTGVSATLVSTNATLLGKGVIAQGADVDLSHDNTANLTIYGDTNAFAISSLGSGNLVTGNVGSSSADADNNSAAVLQVGDNNTATFTQNGTGNAVAISQ